MHEFLIAVGLVLVIEGMVYAVFPQAVRRMIELAGRESESVLRAGGVAVAALGVLFIWVVKSWF